MKMKLVVPALLPVLALVCCTRANSGSQLNEASESGPSFQQVWSQVASDAYDALPHYQVTFSSIGGFFTAKAKEAANATLTNEDDLRPPYEKVVHPNGLCLSGKWTITEESPYTGYFTKGTSAPIIVRASAATSDVARGSRRAFGFAGKIFPTSGPHTANFFAVDDLGGTTAAHYMDVEMTSAPKTSTPPLTEIPVGILILKAFKAVDANATVRQMYPISELGLADPATAQTPHWMKISARAGQSLGEDADFRDELRSAMAANGGKLVFDVSVSAQGDSPQWQTIGAIELDQAVASTSCDQSLHFHHPKWRTDLQEP